MKYLVSLLILVFFFTGCNSDGTTDTQSVKNAPQPELEDSSLQPPKPPSL
jgi:PBP1b-binding outer membrane lipoprotein LpoB